MIVPRTIKALQASLRACREPELRERLEIAIASLKRLYGVPNKSQHNDNGDLRRRRFVKERHPVPITRIVNPADVP
jgi:hypothetical protein